MNILDGSQAFIAGKLDSGIVAILFALPGEFGHVILLISSKNALLGFFFHNSDIAERTRNSKLA